MRGGGRVWAWEGHSIPCATWQQHGGGGSTWEENDFKSTGTLACMRKEEL